MENEMRSESVSSVDSNVDDVIKIAVSKETERKLSELLRRVNENFEAGRVSRKQLADWILARASKDFNDQDIRSIRSQYFDLTDAVASLLRKVQDSANVSPELRSLLMAELGYDAAVKKKK